MKRIMLAGLVLALAGCGGDPSNKEIAQGMIRSFSHETGVSSANLKAKAKRIGNGRWSVTLMAERFGEERTLNATAVMDKNGNIHYYTD